MVQITHCVCENKSFADLLRIARAEKLDIAGLADRTGAGTHCGMCVAYMIEVMRTGQTVITRLLPPVPLPGR
jgi:bacterioferritin-associated ferredoxin